MANYTTGTQVTFVRPGGQLMIRLTSSHTNALCSAAETLKARFFVTRDGWDVAQNLPIWAVFDMRKAEKGSPFFGQWTPPMPSKTFITESPDPAVMWALAKQGAD